METGTLTLKQREVLQLKAHGFGNKQASHQMGIGLRTLDDHLEAIKRKLRARNITHAVSIALRANVIN